MLGVSFALIALNTLLVLVVHIYYPYLYSAASLLLWAGAFLAITGQPHATTDGSKAPMWARGGLAACLGIGVLFGIALCVFNWERMLVH